MIAERPHEGCAKGEAGDLDARIAQGYFTHSFPYPRSQPGFGGGEPGGGDEAEDKQRDGHEQQEAGGGPEPAAELALALAERRAELVHLGVAEAGAIEVEAALGLGAEEVEAVPDAAQAVGALEEEEGDGTEPPARSLFGFELRAVKE